LIYDFPDKTEPIRQGDIFLNIPRFDLDLEKMPIYWGEDRIEEVPWEEISRNGKPVLAIIAAKPVTAIVISQDCDCVRAPDINLCEIREFRDIERKSKQTTSIKKWINIITQQARLNQKWFYLCPNEKLEFKEKMGVDFMVTIRVQRMNLEKLRKFRKGCLNDVAGEHFRERISEFYRRYPYDEWYPLNKEEMVEYLKSHPDAKPLPWQIKTK